MMVSFRKTWTGASGGRLGLQRGNRLKSSKSLIVNNLSSNARVVSSFRKTTLIAGPPIGGFVFSGAAVSSPAVGV